MSFNTNLPGDLTDGDRLFNVDRGSWELNTRMDWTFLREYRYIAGFERAAQVLGEHAAESGADVDALTMPILFCHRQWAELQLKALWSNGSRLISRDAAPLKTHDLRVLWRHVRPIIERDLRPSHSQAPQAGDQLDPVLRGPVRHPPRD